MATKNKAELATVAFLAGVADANGEPLEDDVTENHDWSKFLLAKSMYSNSQYEGPSWVPFGLWSMTEPTGGDDLTRGIAKKLIYSAGAEELWASVEDLYDQPNNVSSALPLELRGITEHWQRISKIKPADHQKKMLRLKANALSLAAEIDRMERLDALLTGEKFDFFRLYSEEELQIVFQNVAVYTLRNHAATIPKEQLFSMTLEQYMAPENPEKPLSPLNRSMAGNAAGPFWELLLGDDEEWPGIVPDLNGMLKRMAVKFDELANKPALKRPAHKNAERNFVAKRLCYFFQNSCGLASPKIIATIVSMFYKQGITENDVSQMLLEARQAS